MLSIKARYLLIFYRFLPSFLWPLRQFIIKISLKKIGKKVRFGPKCLFYDHRLIELGNNIFIGDGTQITTTTLVKIGNNVMFGPEVMIIGGDHNLSRIGKPMIEVKDLGNNLPIKIEEDVWIGARAVILKGVTIKEGAIIGAQSLVNKDILPYSICAGNPCKFIRPRFTLYDLNTHLNVINSKYSLFEIQKLYHEKGIQLTE